MNIRKKLISGLFWSAIERFGQQSIQFIMTIIVARILSPADYGLIGMLAIFIAISQSIIDSGFGTALIQKQKTTQTDFSTIFFFNLFTGILLFFLLFFSAPLIAKFYNQPILIPISRIMAINLIINSFSVIHNVILMKSINFKRLTKINMLSTTFSGFIGILMAYKGFGVWSLVFQLITANLTKTISLWLFNEWRPNLVFSVASLKSLFSYGSKLLASGLLNQIFEHIYKLIIGKQYSAADLGYYTQAQRMQEIPVQNSLDILQRVTFPIYSTIQNETHKLKNVYRKTIKGIIYLNFPLMMILIILAPLLIKILLGEKWLPAVKYLQLLCISGLVYPLSAINLNILKVKGRTDIFFYLEIIKKLIIAIAIIITFRFGILIMVIGQVFVSYICFLINIYYSGNQLNYSVKEQLIDILPYFIISVIMGFPMYLLLVLIPLNPVLSIIVSSILGFSFYLVLSNLLKIEEFYDILAVIGDRKRE